MTKKHRMSPELAAVNGFNSLAACVSGSRQQMLASNLTQNNVIAKPTRKRQRSGLENEFAKGCWYLEFEEDSIVQEVIPRFTSRVYGDRFDLNPLDIVIVEQADTNKLDYVSLPRYHSIHQQYGFSYTYDQDIYSKVVRGARFGKGTKVARSPGVTEDDEWMAGREVNVAMVTHPAGIEDGILIRESCADWLRARGIERRTGSCGRKHYPINLYGTGDSFKIFPDIGEYVDPNGLMFATRPFDEALDPIYMTKNRLKEPIYNVDRTIFCQPQARSMDVSELQDQTEPKRARIIDIRVFHNEHGRSNIPEFMTEQLRKYWEADRRFYLKIIKACLGREGIRGWDGLEKRLTPRLNQLVTYAIGVCGDLLVEEGLWHAKDRKELQLPKTYRGEPLDAWSWEIVFEYLSPIGVGPKLTELHGSKGVITRVVPDEDMFTDENGVVADIVLIPSSGINRMNPGRGHEQLIGAAGRDVIKNLRGMFGLDELKEYTFEQAMDAVRKTPIKDTKEAFEYLFRAYKVICPNIYNKKEMIEKDKDGWMFELLADTIVDGNDPYGLFIQNEIGSIDDYAEMARELTEGEFRPRITPLTYRDLGGRMRTTKKPILIGPMYLLALEKTATDYNGVSVSRTNHFGIGTRLSGVDKHLAPVREVGSNHSGESEMRNMGKSVGGEVIAMLADMNNDPKSAKLVATRILKADQPSNIDQVMVPSEVRGNHRARTFAINRLSAAGKTLVRPVTEE